MAGPEAIASRQPSLPQWQGARAAPRLYMTEVSGDSLRASLQRSARNDSCADTSADLHENEVADIPPTQRVFAKRHDIHVVVDKHGHVDVPPYPPAHVEIVPAGHVLAVWPSGAMLNRSWQSNADGDEVALRPTALLQKKASCSDNPLERGLRAVSYIDGSFMGRQGVPGEIGDGDVTSIRAQIDREHHAGEWVQRELRRGPASRRSRVADRRHQALLHQRVYTRGYRRAREAGDLRKFGACSRFAVAQHLEELAYSRRIVHRADLRRRVRHTSIKTMWNGTGE